MPLPVQNDPLLQFDEMCPSWKANRPRAMSEVELFERGPEMEQTLARVSRRLGFNYNLSMGEDAALAAHKAQTPYILLIFSTHSVAENIDLMWEMCRYDKAWKYVSLSPWCAAFTEDDLKVRSGYEQACCQNERGNCIRRLSSRLTCKSLWRLRLGVCSWLGGLRPSWRALQKPPPLSKGQDGLRPLVAPSAAALGINTTLREGEDRRDASLASLLSAQMAGVGRGPRYALQNGIFVTF